jgi:hypothetical protein
MDREGGALVLPMVSIGTVKARQSRQARPFRPTDGGLLGSSSRPEREARSGGTFSRIARNWQDG